MKILKSGNMTIPCENGKYVVNRVQSNDKKTAEIRLR